MSVTSQDLPVSGQDERDKRDVTHSLKVEETDSGLYCDSFHNRDTITDSISNYTDPRDLQTVRLNIAGTIFEVNIYFLSKYENLF